MPTFGDDRFLNVMERSRQCCKAMLLDDGKKLKGHSTRLLGTGFPSSQLSIRWY
jgi:hypothetical protein